MTIAAEPHRAWGRGRKSHFQFKNWIWDDAGNRQGAKTVYPQDRADADLVNSCYANPASGTRTLYTIVFDLDAHRADPMWKTKKGVLRWKEVSKFLWRKYPELMRHVFAVIRSTSGNGFALAIAISPMELAPETQSAQVAAKILQQKILQLLNYHGLGADPGALGLERDFPNWHDPKRALFRNEILLRAVQSSSEQRPVVTDLLAYLKQFPFLWYQKKSERAGLLYPDIRAERKLAHLYLHVLDNFYTFGPAAVCQLSTQEIATITSLSKPFLKKFLNKSPQWLAAEWLGKNEGWRIRITLESQLTRRAFQLVEDIPEASSFNKSFGEPLKHPSEVVDGERNLWLTQALLLLKHNGTEEAIAQELVREHMKAIPEYQYSRNCRQLDLIVRSIFGNKQHLFGIKPGIAPSWLLTSPSGAYHVGPSLQSLPQATAEEKQTSFKKGAAPPRVVSSVLLRKVSFDGCFSYCGNYYSVPSQFLGQKVQVFAWNNALHVYFAGRKICRHIVVTSCRGKHVVLDHHEREMTAREADYLEDLAESCPGSRRALELVRFRGVYSVRKLWVMKFGSAKRSGDELY